MSFENQFRLALSDNISIEEIVKFINDNKISKFMVIADGVIIGNKFNFLECVNLMSQNLSNVVKTFVIKQHREITIDALCKLMKENIEESDE